MVSVRLRKKKTKIDEKTLLKRKKFRDFEVSNDEKNGDSKGKHSIIFEENMVKLLFIFIYKLNVWWDKKLYVQHGKLCFWMKITVIRKKRYGFERGETKIDFVKNDRLVLC